MELIHQKFATKSWAELLQPAVDLAQFPESKRIFLRDGKFYEPGEIFVQPELAATLKRIQKNGADEFYTGETAQRLASEMAKNGGPITAEDLKQYRAVERAPITGRYKGLDIVSAAPPSSGGIGLLHMRGILEGSGYEKDGPGSASSLHWLAETMRRFYADRGQFLGDPDFVKNPLYGLLSKEYIAKRRASIDPEKATPSSEIAQGDPGLYESAETTHFSIVDAQGNAVAVTYTLNGGFGSGVTVPGLGMLLNNNMDNFATEPGGANAYGLIQGEANAIQPGKRPPSIVSKDGNLLMVIGAPGGTHITSAVTEHNTMESKKYIGMDVHQASISAAVRDDAGKLVMECVIETKAGTILEFIRGLRGSLCVTFEEGTSAAWLYDLVKPHVAQVVVCDPRKNTLLKVGNKNDRVDARKLSE
jgi:gamma-glutamyltranspeptidase / glutathione hydrolase